MRKKFLREVEVYKTWSSDVYFGNLFWLVLQKLGDDVLGKPARVLASSLGIGQRDVRRIVAVREFGGVLQRNSLGLDAKAGERLFDMYLKDVFHYCFPVDPKPWAPRSVSLNVSVSPNSAMATGISMSWPTLSPASTVYGSAPRLTKCVLYSPR